MIRNKTKLKQIIVSRMKERMVQTPDINKMRDDGFSLLEIVVTVAIVLVLSSGGFLVYQDFADNARQASVDSAAREVLTATLASDTTPTGEAPEELVYQYNRTTDDLTANITEATADKLTITTVDRNGTTGTATVVGNYEHIPATEYNTEGAEFEWLGEPHASESIKLIDGEEVSRNLIANPRITDSTYWRPMLNDTFWNGWENGYGAEIRYAEEIPVYSGGNRDEPVMGTGESRAGIVSHLGRELPAGEYTISFDAERIVAGGPIRVIIWDSDQALTAKNITPVEGRNRYVLHLEHDYPIKRVYLDFRRNEDRVVGDTIGYFDKVVLEEGHTDGTYFDGSSR